MQAPLPLSGSAAPNRTAWFAQRLRTDLGYELGIPPQGQDLARACAVVLWKKAQDRGAIVKVEVVCLVDRETYPEHPFPLTAPELHAIGRACLPLAGKSMMGLVDNHLRITVVETAAGPISDADRARLKALHLGMTSALLVECVYLDVVARTRWSSAASERVPGAALVASSLTGIESTSWSRWFEDVMQEYGGAVALSPAHSASPTPSPLLLHAKGPPIVTTSLVGFLAFVFVLEMLLSGSLDPDPGMLIAFGGMYKTAVKSGEWFRLITASLLHGGVLHILFNSLALYLGGTVTELLVGRGWMFVIYTVSALGGSLLGMALNDASLVSVGASGAIMGLLAASFALTLRLPKGGARSALQSQLARFLIPSLLPLASTLTGGKIDYAAHFGGAIAGALLGLFLVAIWGKDLAQPPLRRTSVGLAFASAFAFAIAALGVVRAYPAYAAEGKLKSADVLVAEGVIPKNDADAKRTVETWGKDRPRDPRVHLFRGLRLADEQDLPGAERELREALAEPAILHKFFADRKLEILIRGMLSAVLIDEGRRDDAEREAEPVCHADENGGIPPLLRKLEMCGVKKK